jgi:curved DNA-binding protein CbpA
VADEPDPYDELGVARGAEQEVIEAAYLALIKKHHPDHCEGDDEAGANDRAQRLNAAYALIGSAEKRRAYDARTSAPEPRPEARAAEPAPPRRRRGPRVSVARYFGRGRGEGEPRRIGAGPIALIALTLALLAFWLADVRRYWEPAAPPAAEARP